MSKENTSQTEAQQRINKLVDTMERDDSGNWKLSEEVDDITMAAVLSERRYRDTQASYTKSRQELKRQESITNTLQERILNNASLSLTDEQKTELNELKTSNPDAWRAKINEYETAAKSNLADELAQVVETAGNKGEVEIRAEQMKVWSEQTGIELNDDIVANDLPPRFTKQLESGEITFEQFLTKAGEYLGKEKVIQGTETNDEEDPNFSDVAGSSEPTDEAQGHDFTNTYETTLF